MRHAIQTNRQSDNQSERIRPGSLGGESRLNVDPATLLLSDDQDEYKSVDQVMAKHKLKRSGTNHEENE